MTAIQNDFNRLQETNRANREIQRANRVAEAETMRSNKAREAENVRHNVKTETLKANEIGEKYYADTIKGVGGILKAVI